MITNAHILTECKKNLTNPTFGITDYTSSIGKATYQSPYGNIYLPAPKLYFPVGVNFEMCLGETTLVPANGISFKFFMPDDFAYAGAQCQILFSGDKFFRMSIAVLSSFSDDPNGTYLYKSSRVKTWQSWDLTTWQTLSSLGKVHNAYNTTFWRCRIVKSGYYSAWSDMASFTLSFRQAEKGVLGKDADNNSVTDETGLMYDGTTYW